MITTEIILLRWSDFALQTYTDEQLVRWKIRDKFSFPVEATLEDDKVFILGDPEIKYSHRLFDFIKADEIDNLQPDNRVLSFLKAAVLFLLFLLLPSCVKEDLPQPTCHNELGLVTYWIKYPISDDTLHLTNLGFKTCNGEYYKLSEATVTIDKGMLVDTAFANRVDFNFVRFKPLKF